MKSEAVIFLILGVTLISSGTVLYWPLERFRDWQVTKWPFRVSQGFQLQHEIQVWIREHRLWMIVYRAFMAVLGLAFVAAGLSVR